MNRRSRILCIFLCAFSTLSFADIVLLQNGHVLLNVVMDDTASTWSRPLKVRFRPKSVEYDFDRRTAFPLEGHGNYFDVADFVTTSAILGKDAANEFIVQHEWQNYTPPPPFRIVAPTPTPQPTATPNPHLQLGPGELADETLPLDQRLKKQMDIFMKEQQSLADRINFDQKVGGQKPEAGKELRMELLQRQQRILEENYPSDDARVKNVSEALKDQEDVVTKTGKFSLEHGNY